MGQKLHSVTKYWLLIFLFLHSVSLCNNDNFILMLAPQGHMIVAGSNQATYCLLQATRKGDMLFQKKPWGVVLLDSLRSCAYLKPIRWTWLKPVNISNCFSSEWGQTYTKHMDLYERISGFAKDSCAIFPEKMGIGSKTPLNIFQRQFIWKVPKWF